MIQFMSQALLLVIKVLVVYLSLVIGILIVISLICIFLFAKRTRHLYARLKESEKNLTDFHKCLAQVQDQMVQMQERITQTCDAFSEIKASAIEAQDRLAQTSEVRSAVNLQLVEDTESPITAVSDPTVAQPPSLDIYNRCVYHFKELNSRIESLKKQKTLQCEAFKCLALQSEGINALLGEINQSDINDDIKAQWRTIAHDMEAFLKNELPQIEAWLAVNPHKDISTYTQAIIYPIGVPFDPKLHIDLLGEATPGDIINWVCSLGYIFPGSTIAPFLQEAKVLVRAKKDT